MASGKLLQASEFVLHCKNAIFPASESLKYARGSQAPFAICKWTIRGLMSDKRFFCACAMMSALKPISGITDKEITVVANTNTNNTDRYGALSIGLHWLILLLLIAVYATIELRGIFPKGSALRDGMKA